MTPARPHSRAPGEAVVLSPAEARLLHQLAKGELWPWEYPPRAAKALERLGLCKLHFVLGTGNLARITDAGRAALKEGA